MAEKPLKIKKRQHDSKSETKVLYSTSKVMSKDGGSLMF